jgi:hypothetical protein
VLSFALGGLIYGPFIPLTYALFQSTTPTANLPAVLAARGAVVITSTPLGMVIGGPLVASIGATGTLVASGAATIALAAAASVLWTERGEGARASQRLRSSVKARLAQSLGPTD